MELLWIGIAFACGLAAKGVGLPPLVGFLVAGFVLRALGAQAGGTLQDLANLGVTLMLFSVGLKLRLSTMLKPEVWAVGLGHLALNSGLFALLFLAANALGIAAFVGMTSKTAAVLGFALAFSSTVIAVKVLDERGEGNGTYGTITIGILVLQDLAAVAYLAISSGKVPSIWALGLLLLFPARSLLLRLLAAAGHGELQILAGFVGALGASALFDLVGIKGDLGALVVGAILAGDKSADKLSKTLLGFKDVYLVAFFLTIGLGGLPTISTTVVGLGLLLLLPLKLALYFGLLAAARLRARTAFLTTTSLGNYSEFGLIVVAIIVKQGGLDPSWLLTIAIALAGSFLIAAPVLTRAHQLYAKLTGVLARFETRKRISEEEPIDVEEVGVLVFGMGRVGVATYDEMNKTFPGLVMGVDFDAAVVEHHARAGRRVVLGSAVDPDFWSRLKVEMDEVKLVLIALPNHAEGSIAVEQIRAAGFRGRLAANARHTEDIAHYRTLGVTTVFDLYAEAGYGFVQHVRGSLGKELDEAFGHHGKRSEATGAAAPTG